MTRFAKTLQAFVVLILIGFTCRQNIPCRSDAGQGSMRQYSRPLIRKHLLTVGTDLLSRRHRTQVYRATTEGIIRKVMGGFNGTVFAYGQTSSGKTHTMLGTSHEPGIVPLAVRAIFDHIEATQDREFLLRVSYMEVRTSRKESTSCHGMTGFQCDDERQPQRLVIVVRRAEYTL